MEVIAQIIDGSIGTQRFVRHTRQLFHLQKREQRIMSWFGSPPPSQKSRLLLCYPYAFSCECSVIFMCPQSLFKLKPDFDLVLRDILLAFNNNQVGFLRIG